MFHLLLMDLLFSPLEGGGVLIPAIDKGLDRLDQHFDAGTVEIASTSLLSPFARADLLRGSHGLAGAKGRVLPHSESLYQVRL
jgi:hypothetical protein